MNERILELAKKADLIQWDTLPSGARTPDHESVAKAMKFAELIVRECINQCADNGSNDEWDKGLRWAAKQIKQHFGVE